MKYNVSQKNAPIQSIPIETISLKVYLLKPWLVVCKSLLCSKTLSSCLVKCEFQIKMSKHLHFIVIQQSKTKFFTCPCFV